MKRFSICLSVLFTLLALTLNAQPELVTWKKRIKEADNLLAKGNYAQAGEYYLSAYKEKTSRPDLAYKAGDCFLRIRDYKNASNAFAPIKRKNAEFEQVGYKYAMSLKHMGEYKEAITEFEAYI
ncbi:MAG: outer membrane peptidoglycan-associated protein, partial [Bacteroidota bacterium]